MEIMDKMILETKSAKTLCVVSRERGCGAGWWNSGGVRWMQTIRCGKTLKTAAKRSKKKEKGDHLLSALGEFFR